MKNVRTDLKTFDMTCLNEIIEARGKQHDPYQSFWDELKTILWLHPSNNEWERIENDEKVLGEVWCQPIGKYCYKRMVHEFSYLYVETEGLAIAEHRHYEPANGGLQIRKVKELYVFPDCKMLDYCGKDQRHQLFNGYGRPIYVLSVKVSSKGHKIS